MVTVVSVRLVPNTLLPFSRHVRCVDVRPILLPLAHVVPRLVHSLTVDTAAACLRVWVLRLVVYVFRFWFSSRF